MGRVNPRCHIWFPKHRARSSPNNLLMNAHTCTHAHMYTCVWAPPPVDTAGGGTMPGLSTSPPLSADVRRGHCLSEVQSAVCQAQRSGGEPVTHAECCCGGGRAWGPRCELCPLPGTPAHRALCPLGSGYTADGRGEGCWGAEVRKEAGSPLSMSECVSMNEYICVSVCV